MSQVAITTYFNFPHNPSRLENYHTFQTHLGLPLLTVECAFGSNGFELEGDNIIQVRSNSLLWQKERLINLAIDSLPADVSIVYLLDSDVIFPNSNWSNQGRSVLDRYQSIQLFNFAYHLQPSLLSLAGTEKRLTGFAYSIGASDHGKTGFGWGFRREFLDLIGELYDAMPVGGGDHVLAHALIGQIDHPCMGQSIGTEHQPHYQDWARSVPSSIIGYVNQSIYHLWHGDLENRRYHERQEILHRHKFNPDLDLKINHHGAWEWSGVGDRLRRDVADYFYQRRF
jgi:hypothetical protein